MRLDASVRGRVQGVSFRYYTRQEANRLGLSGWVRNESDGSVSVVAEGTRENLSRFLDFLQHGPPGARVSGVASKLSNQAQEFSSFEIRWI